MMKRYSVYGKLTAKSGHQAELLTCLTAAARGMEELESCCCYIIGLNEDDPESIYVFEVWENAEAHRKSLEEDIFKELIAKAKPIIAEMEDFPSLTIVAGKARF